MSTSVSTRTITINAAFLQEIKDVHQELWQLLADCRQLAGRPLSTWRECAELAEMLQELRDKLALHFALEDAYGYFEDPLDVPAHLAQRALDLREEHATLYVALSELAEEANDLLHERKLTGFTTTVPRRFEEFRERFETHEAREIELIQNAFVEDIGAGD